MKAPWTPSSQLFGCGGARFSECGRYRYTLQRSWLPTDPHMCWIMLNPSTADADVDDPTVRRCVRFAERLGMGGLVVVNLFALRATDPKTLRRVEDPVGPENDEAILEAAKAASRVVVAWGAHGGLLLRDRKVTETLKRHGIALECMGITRDGHPRHPLYLRGDTEPVPFAADSQRRSA